MTMTYNRIGQSLSYSSGVLLTAQHGIYEDIHPVQCDTKEGA
jgi:hypothetical protein